MCELAVKFEKMGIVEKAGDDFMMRFAVDCIIVETAAERLWGDLVAIDPQADSFFKFGSGLDD